MDARAPLKSLRDLELEIESRQTKYVCTCLASILRPLTLVCLASPFRRIKELDAQNRKKPQEQVVSQMEAIGAEIRELSLGLNEKRAEAVKEGQERIWEAYGEVSEVVVSLVKALCTAKQIRSHRAVRKKPGLPVPRGFNTHSHASYAHDGFSSVAHSKRQHLPQVDRRRADGKDEGCRGGSEEDTGRLGGRLAGQD
jgi:ribosomal protein S13